MNKGKTCGLKGSQEKKNKLKSKIERSSRSDGELLKLQGNGDCKNGLKLADKWREIGEK